MQALEKSSLWTKEITSILRKNYSSNYSIYSDFYDLPSHIMTEIIKLAKVNKAKSVNQRIGFSSFDEVCKHIENNVKPLTILTLEIYGLDFLGQHFGQNAIYDVLRKTVEVVFQNISQDDKCYQQEDGKLVFIIAEKNRINHNHNLCVNKIVSAINSTMVFTHNHLFTLKAGFEIFQPQDNQEAKKALMNHK